MTEKIYELIDRLDHTHQLEKNEYEMLVSCSCPEVQQYMAQLARRRTEEVFGEKIYIRGLIEISSFCRNNCLYCGLRRDNAECQRYRLAPDEIAGCADAGYELGFRTIVLQGGEDSSFTDGLLEKLIRDIKSRHPDCAVTLSLGERGRESFERLREAGADRYLLRHETADPVHYSMLHPGDMSFEERMRCLEELRDAGYQTGCGFMAGSPYQRSSHIAEDLKFIEIFSPEMCGIGPFIPHRDTPFAGYPAGSADLTCRLLSILRIMKPDLLLPATTALGSIQHDGRERGILAGANVVMPNLSPPQVRSKYMLYDNKLSSGSEAAENLKELKKKMETIGREIVTDRGDHRSI